MKNMIGKIVLEKGKTNPRVIIACNGVLVRGLELVKCDDDTVVYKHQISKGDIVKIEGYFSNKKLKDVSVSCENSVVINNLKVTEIGKFTEDGYFKLLRSYVNHQAIMGANHPSYLSVRDEVHKQLMKRMQK